MSHDPRGQTAYGVRFDCGPAGALAAGRAARALVIVDVFSFTTATTVAVERGVAVYPAASRDASALRLAREVGAELAVGHRERRGGSETGFSDARSAAR